MSEKRSRKEATSETTFEAFRVAQAQDQKQHGFVVPSLEENPMAWFQWNQAARIAYANRQSEVRAVGAAKRSRQESPVRRVEPEDPLVTTIANCARSVVEGEVPPRSTMGEKALEHARKELFPMPAPGAKGTRELLAVIEIVMRLGLSGLKNAVLSKYLSVVRNLAAEARKQHLVAFRPGHFPCLSVLLDLVALQTVLERWERMPPAGRRSALDAVVAVCSQIEGKASTECAQSLLEKRNGDVDGLEVVDQLAKVRALAASLPFAFPEECREVLLTILPHYEPPTSRLVFPKPVPVGSGNGQDAASKEPAEEGLSVGEVLQRQATNTKSSRKGMTVTSPQRSATGTTAIALAPISALPQRSIAGGKNHVQCASRFHDRFADASKHASSMCRFCATCHLMEILFNGCKVDCVWKHWPTVRRIKFHLSRFPTVCHLALDRFHQMERGEVLGSYTGQL